ncbi:MAG: VWA domain-containing protein, partial [Akkermansia sp.]
TAIGSAIAAAATRLESRKDTKSKIIILVTDGASNSGQISPLEAAEAAAKLGIKIYTIAVGTDDDRMGGGFVAGQSFDEPTLRKIASVTGGEHFRATDTNKLLLAFSSIDKLEKTEAKAYTTVTERDLFLYFLVAGASLMLIGLCLQILRPTPAP